MLSRQGRQPLDPPTILGCRGGTATGSLLGR
jgi:hypothetical protein